MICSICWCTDKFKNVQEHSVDKCDGDRKTDVTLVRYILIN
jgi:ribosomal protein S12